MDNKIKIIEKTIYPLVDIIEDYFEEKLEELVSEKVGVYQSSMKIFVPRDNWATIEPLSVIEEDQLKSNFKHALTSWGWHSKYRVSDRFLKIFKDHPNFLHKLVDDQRKLQSGLKILDLGCGFCSYWPFLELLGVNDFVGVDLFDNRNQKKSSDTWLVEGMQAECVNSTLKEQYQCLESYQSNIPIRALPEALSTIINSYMSMLAALSNHHQTFIPLAYLLYTEAFQHYHRSAIEFVREFLHNDSCSRVIAGDVRDISYFLSKEDRKSFDYILAINPGKAKKQAGTTGIPKKLVDDICDIFLKDDGMLVFDEC